MEKVTPFGDRVLVRRVKAPDKTPGGIHLPDSAKNRNLSRGVVLAVGPGAVKEAAFIAPEAKVGQTVLFYGGVPVGDGDDVLILGAGEILGAVNA